jgi:MerR family Zn(II)-responsive transcriptional regulator of zntA
MAEAVHIGTASKLAEISVDAIRFYQRLGLTKTANRSAGGYRLFDGEQIRDLKFIRHAQELGFSLAEIRQLLALRQKHHACPEVQAMLKSKLAHVREKIRSLSRLEDELGDALRNCNRELRARRKLSHQDSCPLFTRLDQMNGAKGKKYVSRSPRPGNK